MIFIAPFIMGPQDIYFWDVIKSMFFLRRWTKYLLTLYEPKKQVTVNQIPICTLKDPTSSGYEHLDLKNTRYVFLKRTTDHIHTLKICTECSLPWNKIQSSPCSSEISPLWSKSDLLMSEATSWKKVWCYTDRLWGQGDLSDF